MLNLKVRERQTPTEAFREEVMKAFDGVAQVVDQTFDKVRAANDKVENLIATVASLEKQQVEKEAEAEALRGTIAEALMEGKDTDGLIQQRASLLAGAQVIKDLIVDTNRVKIPAAQQAAQTLSKAAANALIIELDKMKNHFQEKHISPMFFEVAGMVNVYLQCLQEFYGRYPGVSLPRDPVVSIPMVR